MRVVRSSRSLSCWQSISNVEKADPERYGIIKADASGWCAKTRERGHVHCRHMTLAKLFDISTIIFPPQNTNIVRTANGTMGDSQAAEDFWLFGYG